MQNRVDCPRLAGPSGSSRCRALIHRVILLGLLLGWSGCRELWDATLEVDPTNCVQTATLCSADQVCNRITEQCEPALTLDLVEPARSSSIGGGTVTIRGRGFLPGTAVSFGALGAEPVLLTSPTELRTTLPSSLGTCGPVPVQLRRPGGISVSRSDLFSYSLQSVRFASAQLIAEHPSTSTVYVTTHDLDGDGRADVLATAYNHAGVDILLGNGDGSFRSQPRLPTGGGPYHIAVGDVNRDAIPDVTVANNSGNTVTVLIGTGGGSFRAPLNLANNAAQSSHFLDVNDDALLDLAVLTSDGKLRLWSGDGGGGFTFLSEVAPNIASALSTAVDVDGDGRLDLIKTARFAPGLTVLRNLGDGTFREVGTNSLGAFPTSCAGADFNSDGKVDLVVAEYAAGLVSVLLGRGDGTFEPRRSMASGGGSRVVAPADFNCDGRMDIVVSHLGSPQVTVLLGRGDGTFDPSTISASVPGATSALAVTTADINGDRRPDLLLGVDGVSPSVRAMMNTSQ